MVAFPNCKINLGLHVISKRLDGFHNIGTVFYPIRLNDAVEIIENKDSNAPEILFSQSGNMVDGPVENNLCLQAYSIIKKAYPFIPPLKIHLHKFIPTGAGLGGGSSDATVVLKMLNEKFELNISPETMLAFALELGSDCPFFLLNKPCLATGRGEELHPIEIDLNPYNILIVYPGIHVNTGWAFSQLILKNHTNSIQEIIQQPISEWHQVLTNDFEAAVFAHYPAIKEIKDTLYEKGAVYASMSGSGSSVFGIFKQADPFMKFPGNYVHKWI